MKELTIEEKAARYDEAIDIARKINSGEGVEASSDWTTCEVIFPELKENEDEKIRKELIEFVKSRLAGFPECDKFVAWLEEQGETFTKKDVDDAYLKGISDAKQELEKQSEQKLTVPKWRYKNDNTPLLRDSLILNKYGCVGKSPSGALVNDVWVMDYGELAKLPKEEIEKQGEQSTTDKVEPKFNFNVGQWIVATGKCAYLITKIEDFDVTLVDTNGNEYIFDIYSLRDAHLYTIQDAKNGDVLVCPKYAGDIIPNIFIFKNIERKDNDVFCHCSFLEKFRTEGYVANADPINTDFYPATKEQRDTLIKAMTDAGYIFDFDKKELKKIENPIAWSEEDEDYINDLIKYFSQNERLKNTKEDIVIWLKSLKQQKHWKPSDAQMDSITCAVRKMKESACYDSELVSLHQDLKKLKE